MSSVLDLLRDARDRISDPKRWTKDTSARDRFGNPTCSTSPDAVCWCALGSLTLSEFLSSGLVGYSDRFRRMTKALEDECENATIQAVNDCNGHDAILAAFDRAIANACRV